MSFLDDAVAGEMGERLVVVNREFPLSLDLSAGTGATSQAMLATGKIGRLVRMDASWTLIGRLPRPKLVGEAEALPFRGECLDLVFSALALHAVNDLPGTLVQIRRILKPDGLFMAALLGAGTLFELREAMLQAEDERHGGAAVRVAPFVDLREMGTLLQRAGFAVPVTDVDRLTVRYSNALELMRDLRGMGMTNPLAARSRAPVPRATLLRAAEIYAERFSDPDGRVRATFTILSMSGWAPHESQQKPLRPGSAKTRLADALGTREHSLGVKAVPREQ